MDTYNTSTDSDVLNITKNPCEYLSLVYDITDNINFVVTLVGVLGNTVSVLVFRSTTLRNAPHSPFIVGLNASDTVYLISHMVFTILLYRTGILEVGTSNTILQLVRRYLETSSGTISLLYVLLFTIQRFLMVRFPRTVVTTKMVRHKSTIAMALPIFTCFVYLPLLILSNSESILLRLIFLLVLRVVPGALVVALNFTIVYTLKKRTAALRSSMCSEEDAFQKVNILLFAVSFSFIVLNVPFAIVYGYVAIKGYRVPCRSYGVNVDPSVSIAYIVCCLIFDCNFAINFFLYCLSAKNFREALKSFWRDLPPNQFIQQIREPMKNMSYHKRMTESVTIE